MAAPLSVGDHVQFAGHTGTIVATTATTDANGLGSIAYEGLTYLFKAVRVTGPDVPLVATADPWFRVGLLKHPTEATFALVLDDPHEGRLIRGRHGATGDAWQPALQDWIQLFVTCWEGSAKVICGGSPAASVYVGLDCLYSTTQGTHLAWPLSPWPNRSDGTVTNTVRGSWKTDANGNVKHLLPNATTERLLFPRGHGAWGQRATDRMWQGPDAPAPERKLTKVRVVYGAQVSPPPPGDNLAIQEAAEITEGSGATLVCRNSNLTINGPASAGFRAQLEGSGVYRAGALSGAGTITLTDMLPGTWHVRIGPAYSTTTSWPARQTVEVPVNGTGTVSFGASSALPAPPNHVVAGFTYRYGAVASDATLYITYQSPGQPDVTESTSAGSYSLPFRKTLGGWAYTAKEVWVYDGEGYWGQNVTTYSITGIFFNMAVGGKAVLNAEVWGRWGNHLHAFPPSLVAHISHTGAPDTVFTDLVQHGETGLYISNDPTFSHKGPTTAGNYTMYAEDGSVLGNGTSGNDPLPSSAGGDDFGIAQTCTVGGRIHGNMVGTTQDKIEVDVPLLEDAARLGAERGKLVWGLEWRHYSNTAEGREVGANWVGRALAFAGMECPLCGGEVWRLPNAGIYTRGYCSQCAYHGRGNCEARTFLASVTLPSLADWRCFATCVATSGGMHQRDLWSHWRPEDYREVAGYESDKSWLGPGGYARYLAAHWTFATWGANGFVDGTDIAAQEALLPATLALRKAAGHCPASIGPCQLKAIAANGYQYLGAPATFRATCTRPDLGSDTVDFIIPTGFAGAGVGGRTFSDFVRLSSREQIASDTGVFSPNAGFYTDVTSLVCLTDPAPGGVRFTLVNDAPHRNNGVGVPVTEGAAEPYVVLWLPVHKEGEPYVCLGAAGWVHRVLIADGWVVYDRLEGGSVWSERIAVSREGDHCYCPCVVELPTGDLLVTYTSGSMSGGTVARMGHVGDDGAFIWEDMVSFVASIGLVEIKLDAAGNLGAVGVSGGKAWFGISDDDGASPLPWPPSNALYSEIGPADEVPPTLVFTDTGKLLMCLTDSGLVKMYFGYVNPDGSMTWELQT